MPLMRSHGSCSDSPAFRGTTDVSTPRRECVRDIHTPASLCARAFTEPAAFPFATSRVQSARDPDQLVPFECGTLNLGPRRFGAACECCPEQAANWGAVADIIKPGQRGAFAREKWATISGMMDSPDAPFV